MEGFNILKYKIYKNPLEDWLIAICVIVLTIVLAQFIYWLLRSILRQFTKRTATELDDLILERIDKPIVLVIILVGIWIALDQLQFSKKTESFLFKGFAITGAVALTWLIARIIGTGIEHYFKQYGDKTGSRLDKQMMQLVRRVLISILWVVGVIVGLNTAGFNVGALWAGLGIGGLAVALAAQDTVRNIIGGLIVFADRPFRTGDVIKIREFEGTVLYIGIRSSRLRTPAGRIITMPNAQFSENPIENVTLEPSKRVVTYLSLIYETPSEKIDEAIDILNKILEQTPDILAYDSVVYLEKFSQSSIDINMTYFIKKGSDTHAAQTAVNKEVLKRFAAAGLEFAYPTQTVFEKK